MFNLWYLLHRNFIHEGGRNEKTFPIKTLSFSKKPKRRFEKKILSYLMISISNFYISQLRKFPEKFHLARFIFKVKQNSANWSRNEHAFALIVNDIVAGKQLIGLCSFARRRLQSIEPFVNLIFVGCVKLSLQV